MMVGFIAQESGDAGANPYDLSQVPLPPPWWDADAALAKSYVGIGKTMRLPSFLGSFSAEMLGLCHRDSAPFLRALDFASDVVVAIIISASTRLWRSGDSCQQSLMLPAVRLLICMRRIPDGWRVYAREAFRALSPGYPVR